MIQDRFRLDDKVAIVTGRRPRHRGRVRRSRWPRPAPTSSCRRARRSSSTPSPRRSRPWAGAPSWCPPTSATSTRSPGWPSIAKRELGRVDIVVNNVGGTMPRPFLDTSPERLIREFSWNVATAHALTRAAVPLMLEGGGGAVVGISSMMGRTAGRGFVAYGTAKAALSHWTRLAAQDLAPRIRVNAIAVGSIATSALEIVLDDDGLRTAMEQGTPLKRIGDPEEIAATVLFLASPAGGYVTGKVVEVDGGIEQPNLDMGLPDL